MSQGARANDSGKVAEDAIEATLDRCAIAYDREYIACLGIYNTPIKVDFYLRPRGTYSAGLVIESKWQDVGGSVDEKLPYLVANIKACYPCPAVIVIDGTGFRPGAVLWLRQQADGERLIAVYSLAQFITWVNRTLRRM